MKGSSSAIAARESSIRHPEVYIYVDGASKGNPGNAGIGAILTSNGKTISKISEYIGKTTNNVAEYLAVYRAFQEAKRLNADSVRIFSDSQLVVNQLNGLYSIKDKKLQQISAKVMAVAGKFKKWSIEYIEKRKKQRGR